MLASARARKAAGKAAIAAGSGQTGARVKLEALGAALANKALKLNCANREAFNTKCYKI